MDRDVNWEEDEEEKHLKPPTEDSRVNQPAEEAESGTNNTNEVDIDGDLVQDWSRYPDVPRDQELDIASHWTLCVVEREGLIPAFTLG